MVVFVARDGDGSGEDGVVRDGRTSSDISTVTASVVCHGIGNVPNSIKIN